MLTWLIIAICFFLIAWKFYKDICLDWRYLIKEWKENIKKNPFETISNSCLIIVFLAIFLVITSMFAVLAAWPFYGGIRYFVEERETVTNVQKIVSLNQGDVVSGSFVLGCGTIGQANE